MDQTYTWELNGGRGMTWPNIGTLVANMQFKIVDADPARHNIEDGKLTATTLSYHYHFVQAKSNNKALWRMHWHPGGLSDFLDPHIHRLPDIKPHWPTPRLSFETAIRWCIAEGTPLACPSTAVAEDRLTESESVLRLYATWRDVSDPNYPVRKKPEGT